MPWVVQIEILGFSLYCQLRIVCVSCELHLQNTTVGTFEIHCQTVKCITANKVKMQLLNLRIKILPKAERKSTYQIILLKVKEKTPGKCVLNSTRLQMTSALIYMKMNHQANFPPEILTRCFSTSLSPNINISHMVEFLISFHQVKQWDVSHLRTVSCPIR